MAPGIAPSKGHGRGHFLPLEANMHTRQKNIPNYSFLIESFNDSGDRIVWFRLDQVVANPQRRHEVERATNVVESHLHHLHKRTGLNYSCFAQGLKDEIDKTIKSLSIELD